MQEDQQGDRDDQVATQRTQEAEHRALQEAIAQEELQLQKERRAILNAGRMEYIAQVKDRIERNWSRPAGSDPGLECVVRVTQIPGGEVVQVEIRQSSGNRAFDRSVEEAVFHASPPRCRRIRRCSTGRSSSPSNRRCERKHEKQEKEKMRPGAK